MKKLMRRIFQTNPLQFWCLLSTYLDLYSNHLSHFLPPCPAPYIPSFSITYILSGVRVYKQWQLLPIHLLKPPWGLLGILLPTSTTPGLPAFHAPRLQAWAAAPQQSHLQVWFTRGCFDVLPEHQRAGPGSAPGAGSRRQARPGAARQEHNPPAHQRLCRSDRRHPAGSLLWKDTVPNNTTVIRR